MTVQVFDDIDRHDIRRFTVVFTNFAGAPTDPTAVLFTLVSPSGVETVYTYGVGVEIVKDSTGTYHYDLTALEELSYWGRFHGTGSIIAAAVFEARVRTDVFST